MVSHARCKPLSDKLPFCKIDAIAIGVIVVTILFLLVCLERIFKYSRRITSRERDGQQHSQPTTQDKSLSTEDSSNSLDGKYNFEIDDSGDTLPLYHCPGQSASGIPGQHNSYWSRFNFRSLFPGSNLNITQPTLARTYPNDVQRAVPSAASLPKFTGRWGGRSIIPDYSGDTLCGSPTRISTPKSTPPLGSYS